MDLHKMQYFKDVYELNSFTKAANKNFVYQSAVTQQIASKNHPYAGREHFLSGVPGYIG